MRRTSNKIIQIKDVWQYCDHPKELFEDVDCSYTIGFCSKCGASWENIQEWKEINNPGVPQLWRRDIGLVNRVPDDYLDYEIATRYDIRYVDGYNGYFIPRKPLK